MLVLVDSEQDSVHDTVHDALKPLMIVHREKKKCLLASHCSSFSFGAC